MAHFSALRHIVVDGILVPRGIAVLDVAVKILTRVANTSAQASYAPKYLTAMVQATAACAIGTSLVIQLSR